MANRTAKTSLETVTTGEINSLESATKLIIEDALKSIKENRKNIDETIIGTAIDKIIHDFPGELKSELGGKKIEAIKKDWTVRINNFCANSKHGQEPTPKDLENLVAQLFMSLMGEHTHAVLQNPVVLSALSEDSNAEFENNYNPIVRNKYPSIAA